MKIYATIKTPFSLYCNRQNSAVKVFTSSANQFIKLNKPMDQY